MALNASGPISLAGSTTGQSIAVELGLGTTTQISLNQAAVRTLAGIASGAIIMPTNFWGKSNTPTKKAIFGYGFSYSPTTYYSLTNLVSATGVVAANVTNANQTRYNLAASGFGSDKGIFLFGNKPLAPTSTAITTLVSNTGVLASDTAAVAGVTIKTGLAACTYGTTGQAIATFGNAPTLTSTTVNYISNAGVVAATVASAATTGRFSISAVGYSTDKGYVYTGLNGSTVLNAVNLISNTGVVAADSATAAGTIRFGTAAARYGSSGQAVIGFGGSGGPLAYTNLLSNTAVVAANVAGLGTARINPAASNIGVDIAIFGFGYDNGSTSYNSTQLVSNTGVVAANQATSTGTARTFLACSSWGA